MFAPLLLVALCTAPSATAEGPATGGRPIVIAHRGASGLLPEHTTQAVAVAHALGADFIEQDVVLTRDGVPIVLHDLYLDATTNVAEVFPNRAAAGAKIGRRFPALNFSLTEIKTLRVSERFDPHTGRAAFPTRFPGRGVAVDGAGGAGCGARLGGASLDGPARRLAAAPDRAGRLRRPARRGVGRGGERSIHRLSRPHRPPVPPTRT